MDAAQHLLVRRDAVGDAQGAIECLVARINYSDGFQRFETAAGTGGVGAHHDLTLRRRAGEGAQVFLNGFVATLSADSEARTGVLRIPGGPMYIGAGSKDSTTGGWTGQIDELRFAARAMSNAWVTAERNMQRDTRRMYGVGARDEPDHLVESIVAIPLSVDATTAIPIDIAIAGMVTNPDGASVSLISVSEVTHGTVTLTGGKARYTSPAAFTGIDVFTYVVRGRRQAKHRALCGRGP